MKSEDIINVRVDKISLVTKNERPAVEKAESKFSIFKTFRLFKKSDSNVGKLENIQKILQKKVNDLENAQDCH